MKKVIFVLFLLISNVFLFATKQQISAHRTDIYGNLTGSLTIADSPYYIVDDTIIPEDSTLTIEPGVEIYFTNQHFLLINGIMIAEGTETDSIKFIGSHESANQYIFFNSTSDNSIISYSIIKDFEGSTLFVDSANITISHCNFHNNNSSFAKLINLSGSNLTFSNNILNNNHVEHNSIILLSNCNATISNNIFINNQGGISSNTSENIIINNIIKNNISSTSIIDCFCSNDLISGNLIANNHCETNGGGLRIFSSRATVTSNIITNNYTENNGGGVFLSDYDGEFHNNLITNNFAVSGGGGLYLWNSNGIFRNNTIAKNKSSNHGSAINFNMSSNPLFINNIIYGNRNNGQVYISSSTPYFYHCNIEGGSELFVGDNLPEENYADNIDSNPLWIAPANGVGHQVDTENTDYHLQNNSPCIDAGYIYSDEDGTICDIGAFTTDNFAGTGNILSNFVNNESIPEVIDSDLIIFGNITVPENSTLTINPGVTLQFIGGSLTVSGTLIAEGTENSPITFTSYQSAKWQGIEFSNCSANCIISHSIIKNSVDSGITCLQSQPTITYNIIANNRACCGGGILSDQSKSTINNNLIINNTSTSGGGIAFSNSQPIFRNNTIAKNKADFAGGIKIDNTSLISINNIIYQNIGDYDGAQINISYPNTFCFINCDIEGGINAFEGVDIASENYINNIDAYPSWITPSEGVGCQFDTENSDFHLQSNSPCIDCGTIYFDEDGTINDIGAFTVSGTTGNTIPGIDIFHGGVLNGTIENDMVIDGNIYVPENSSLTINPGVTLNFIGSSLLVAGSLTAEGTENNNIVFKDYCGTLWHGINLLKTSNNNTVSYSIVKNSISSGIYLTGSNLNLSNSIITNNISKNGGGLFLNSQNVILKNNLIANNTSLVNGGGIYSSKYFVPGNNVFNIYNNTITRNTAKGLGAAICFKSGDIRNTIIYGNENTSIEGEQIYLGSQYTQIHNCDIPNDSLTFSGFTDFSQENFYGNINSDPLWIAPADSAGFSANTENTSYYLQADSPCIDAGNFCYDEDNSISDIGAFTTNGWAGTGAIINTPPVIISFNPPDSSFEIENFQEINFSVYAYDIENIISYQWFLNSIEQNNNTSDFTYNFDQQGSFEIKCVVSDGENETEQIWHITTNFTENSVNEAIPKITELIGNYPNPFNPETTINFTVKKNDRASIDIFNIKGQLVKTYPEFKTGYHKLIWAGKNNNGRKVGSGIYFYRLKSKSISQVHKMLMLK